MSGRLDRGQTVLPPYGGGEEQPRLRLPARADKGPSGAPTNGLSLWGGLLAGFRRGRNHGATLGSTAESGKTMGGGFTHIGSSFTFSGPSLMLKAGPTPSPLGPSLPKSVAPFLPNPSPTLRPLP